MDKVNLIQKKSFEFSHSATEFYKKLLSKNENILSVQFFKSAASASLNDEDLMAGYSKKDFAAKMSVVLKEGRESLYWLKLIEACNFVAHDFQILKE